MYESSTHWISERSASSPARISTCATLTMVVSSNSMNTAVHSTTSTSHGLRAGCAAPADEPGRLTGVVATLLGSPSTKLLNRAGAASSASPTSPALRGGRLFLDYVTWIELQCLGQHLDRTQQVGAFFRGELVQGGADLRAPHGMHL